MTRACALTCLALALSARAGRAQLEVTGYTLGVGSVAAASELSDAGASALGRGRLMVGYATGTLSVETAYEHIVRRQPEDGGFSFTSAGAGGTSTDWLPLGWTLHDSETSEWRHRFDRLSVRATRGQLEAIVGRQAISWATTLFLTPADPFAPFDPSDPFREYRGGVDALRLRGFAGPFTEIEAIVRPTDTATGSTMTALARMGTSKGGWAVGGWGGLLHDEPAGALFASGTLGSTSMRGELALRKGPNDDSVARFALGFDHFFRPGSKDLYLVGEVQFDGYGASSPGELIQVARSDAFLRGDMQVLGRWAIATQASYQWHPLVGFSALALVNPGDPSLLLAPGVSWSATSYGAARVGMYFGFGRDAESLSLLGSEYGSLPGLGYLSFSAFF